MSLDSWLPLLIVLSSLLPGIAIFFLREENYGLRTLLNLFGAVAKLVLVGVGLMVLMAFRPQGILGNREELLIGDT